MITLAQLAAVEDKPLRKAVIMNIIRDAQIMNFIPFENISSLTALGVRWSKLPTGGSWRSLNEGYTNAEEGTVEQVQESLYGFGGEIKYDRIIDKLSGFIVDPVTTQTKMKIKALAYDWKDAFINGDHASNPKSIEGLKKRVSNLPSRQYVRFAGTGAASVLDPTADAASARAFLDKLETAWVRCNDGMVDLICCNEGVKLGLGRVLRYLQTAGNFLDTGQDVAGREFYTWKGKPLIDMGLKADQSTEIIPNNETADDGGTDSTSMYFMSFDMEQGIIGAQVEDLQVYDPLDGAESPTAPQLIRRIDWWNGLVMIGSYGLVRATNLEDPSAWT